MERLSDVQNLVMQLYEALHVGEHQLKKERQLLAQLEQLQTELLPLEEVCSLRLFLISAQHLDSSACI